MSLAKGRGDRIRLGAVEMAFEELGDRLLQLPDRHLRLVGQNQGLVIDVLRLLACHRAQDGGGGVGTHHRVHRSEHGVVTHDDLVGGQRQQGTAGHGVVRDEGSDLGGVARQRPRDLQRGQRQTTGRVQDQVDRLFRRGLVDRPHHFFGILDIDVAHERDAEQAHAFLAMHQQDNPAGTLGFHGDAQPPPCRRQQTLLHQGLNCDHDQQQPEQARVFRHRALPRTSLQSRPSGRPKSCLESNRFRPQDSQVG
jgi:hypothetical protein